MHGVIDPVLRETLHAVYRESRAELERVLHGAEPNEEGEEKEGVLGAAHYRGCVEQADIAEDVPQPHRPARLTP